MNDNTSYRFSFFGHHTHFENNESEDHSVNIKNTMGETKTDKEADTMKNILFAVFSAAVLFAGLVFGGLKLLNTITPELTGAGSSDLPDMEELAAENHRYHSWQDAFTDILSEKRYAEAGLLSGRSMEDKHIYAWLMCFDSDDVPELFVYQRFSPRLLIYRYTELGMGEGHTGYTDVSVMDLSEAWEGVCYFRTGLGQCALSPDKGEYSFIEPLSIHPGRTFMRMLPYGDSSYITATEAERTEYDFGYDEAGGYIYMGQSWVQFCWLRIEDCSYAVEITDMRPAGVFDTLMENYVFTPADGDTVS